MFNNRRYWWRSSVYVPALAGIALAGFSAGLQAGSLEVQVLNRQSGDTIANAAVCLGTSAKPDQFGARRTDADGVVRFEDLPPNALVVTVSNRGLQGTQRVLEPVVQDRVIVLKVASGGGGPQCDAPPATTGSANAPSELAIDSVDIGKVPGGGAGEVLLTLKVSGVANQVRIGESPDLADAAWQALKSPLAFSLSPGSGVKQLYVQVRHRIQAEGAVIEVVSPVERVAYRRN